MNSQELDDFQDKIENNLYSTLENFALFQAEIMIDEKSKEIRKEMKRMKEEIENELIYEIYKTKRELLNEIAAKTGTLAKRRWWHLW